MSTSIYNMGLNTVSIKGYKLEYPHGVPYYVFVQMLTPGYTTTSKGVEQIEPYDCILFTPNTPRILYTANDYVSYRDNWVFFESDEAEEWIGKYGIQPNRIYHLDPDNHVTDCMSMLFAEYIRSGQQDADMLSLLLQQMLIYVSRGKKANDKNQYLMNRRNEAIVKLRFEIYKDVAREWTIEKIADELGISTTWLNVLYRNRYGTSPKQDIQNARIEQAKQMLIYENLPLHDIAQLSGFQNEYYFSRVFSKRMGLSPSEYRRQKRKEEARAK